MDTDQLEIEVTGCALCCDICGEGDDHETAALSHLEEAGQLVKKADAHRREATRLSKMSVSHRTAATWHREQAKH